MANYVNNRKRRNIAKLEEERKLSVQILGAKGVLPEHLDLHCTIATGISRRGREGGIERTLGPRGAAEAMATPNRRRRVPVL